MKNKKNVKSKKNSKDKTVKTKAVKEKKVKAAEPKEKEIKSRSVKNTDNKNKSILARFFSHNIVLLVLSFILAFTIWFIINASSETDSNVTISNIPVTIELSEMAEQDGLEIFIGDDITASVEVSGNRVTVGSLTSADILVSAGQTGAIIAPGTYTLPLTAKKTGLKSNYEIVSSVTPSTITVYVDRAKDEEFPVENRLSVQLDDSNHYASTSLSQNTVLLTGPEAQINQIESVAVIDSITAGSDESKTVQESIHYLDADGKTLELPLVKADVETIEATITVLPVMNVTLAVETVGMPKNCSPISITPQTVKIAGPQSVLDSIENDTVSIGSLDFSKLKNEKHKFTYDISLPSGCKVISGETSATVAVDLSNYVKNTVEARISAKIDSSKYSVEFNTTTVNVEVYGPSGVVGNITPSHVTAVADFTDLLDGVTGNKSVSLSVPIKITFSSGYAECWAYGAYTTTANVSLK